MKMKWWEIAAIIALLGAIASLGWAEGAGFTSDTAGRIWVGSSIVTFIALFGAGWNARRIDSLANRRWKGALIAVMPITQLIYALRLFLPYVGPVNGPYCVQGSQTGGQGMVCLPL